MHIEIRINCEGDAFTAGNGPKEVAVILYELATAISPDSDIRPGVMVLKDSNGNTVGFYRVSA
jgi:hypothetical protein